MIEGIKLSDESLLMMRIVDKMNENREEDEVLYHLGNIPQSLIKFWTEYFKQEDNN